MGLLKKIGGFLGKVAKVVLPVVGVVTGVAAIGGIIKGVGALKGIGAVVAGGKSVISKVGASAVNLVTGTTQEERVQVKAQKTITKALSDKVEQVQRLIKAGATRESAMSTVGLSQTELDTPVDVLLPTSTLVDAASTGGIVEKTSGAKVVDSLVSAGTGCIVTAALILSSLAGAAFIIIVILL